VIQNLKDGSLIKIANFQALIDDSYNHNNNWGDQKIDLRSQNGENEGGSLAQKKVNLLLNLTNDVYQQQSGCHMNMESRKQQDE
jgi:hypothetical protein